jgi:transglutaminase-like putative cysteine protease
VPAVNERDWFKSLGNDWTSNGRVGLTRDPKYGAEMLHVAWTDEEKNPFIEVTSKIATRDRATDFAKAGVPAPLSAVERTLYTEGTELIPVDGIVRETSDKIVAAANAATNVEKARAIYEWIVDNSFRDAKVRGCGIGDIAAMLKTGNLDGKCADSTRSMSAWRGLPVCPRAISTASASRHRSSATKASAQVRR